MRWIFRYNERAAQILGRILKKKMPKTEPWLHIAIKTPSRRNPWSGAVIYIWDTRQVVWEYRASGAGLKTEDFKVANGLTRALDNRKPLVGGRKDVNEYFEFGADFDASKGKAFDGKDRVVFTDLYKRKSEKQVPKPGKEHLAIRRLLASEIKVGMECCDCNAMPMTVVAITESKVFCKDKFGKVYAYACEAKGLSYDKFQGTELAHKLRQAIIAWLRSTRNRPTKKDFMDFVEWGYEANRGAHEQVDEKAPWAESKDADKLEAALMNAMRNCRPDEWPSKAAYMQLMDAVWKQQVSR